MFYEQFKDPFYKWINTSTKTKEETCDDTEIQVLPLRVAVSPLRKLKRFMMLREEICEEEEFNADEEFGIKILKMLLSGAKYNDILALKSYTPIKDKEKIIEREIIYYLQNVDSLPLYPSVEDYANHIQAPKDYVERLFNGLNNNNFIRLFPQTDENEFSEIFGAKLLSVYARFKRHGFTPGTPCIMPQGYKITRQVLHECIYGWLDSIV